MLKVFDHPLIRHKLTIMRDKNTSSKDFRQNLNEIASLMVYEITRDFPVKEKQVDTPLCSCQGYELSKEIKNFLCSSLPKRNLKNTSDSRLVICLFSFLVLRSSA